MDAINPRFLTDFIMSTIFGFTLLFVPFHTYVTSKTSYFYGLIFIMIYGGVVFFVPGAVAPLLVLLLFYLVLTTLLKLNFVQGLIGSVLIMIAAIFSEVFVALVFPLLFNYPLDLLIFGATTHWQASFYSHILMIVFALILGLLVQKQIPKILKPFETLRKIHIIGALIILGGFISYLFYTLVFSDTLIIFTENRVEQVVIVSFFISLLIFFSYLHYQHLLQVHEKEEMLAQAERDFLTRAYHRGPGLKYAKEQLQLCKSRKLSITFGFVDLNDLKIINDQYGHPEGDQYIQDFSEILLKNIRAADLFIRYGGDEFMFVLPGATKEKALDLEEKLNHGIAEKGKDLPYHRSFSIGVYETPPTEDIDLDKIMKIVDHKMYIDKKVHKSNKKSISRMDEGALPLGETPLEG